MWRREIFSAEPTQVAELLSALPHLSYLDSAMQQGDRGRFSYVAADPFATFKVRGGVAYWQDAPIEKTPLAALREIFARYRHQTLDEGPPFQGGAIGYFSYDFGRAFENLAVPTTHEAICDEAAFHFYDVVFAFDHLQERCWLIASGWPETDPKERARRANQRLDFFQSLLTSNPTASRSVPVKPSELLWKSNFTRDNYMIAVDCVKEYIAAGDIYQANIAQRFSTVLHPEFDRWGFYKKLRTVNAAPFAAYLCFGNYVLASSSPERFLQLHNGRVEARPIKGTAKRHVDDHADRLAAEALRASDKDRAENVMIVDLMRNDLSRVCAPGSVQVPTLCGLESYASVHHLVSVVTGKISDGKDAFDLLEATFPGGSITGAPKLRAMEIITEIEKTTREVYCGSIGYIGFDGAMDMNIAIRTVIFGPDCAVFQAGGGITLLSLPDAEYDETLIKASRIFDAFEQFQNEIANLEDPACS